MKISWIVGPDRTMPLSGNEALDTKMPLSDALQIKLYFKTVQVSKDGQVKICHNILN